MTDITNTDTVNSENRESNRPLLFTLGPEGFTRPAGSIPSVENEQLAQVYQANQQALHAQRAAIRANAIAARIANRAVLQAAWDMRIAQGNEIPQGDASAVSLIRRHR